MEAEIDPEKRFVPLFISSAGVMLVKARHDLQRMKGALNAYAVFDFFVTCYHIKDYLKGAPGADGSALKSFLCDPDFQMARFICNRGKHLTLETRNDRKVNEFLAGGRPGILRLGATRLGEPVRWRLFIDEREVYPVELGERLIQKWEQFFDIHNIAR